MSIVIGGSLTILFDLRMVSYVTLGHVASHVLHVIRRGLDPRVLLRYTYATIE
jgi:hypothetical protein